MDYRLLADLVLAVHGLFVAFVVFGGLLALWKRWIAYLHLPALAWGALVIGMGWICPLTPLEVSLRQRAGDQGYDGGFIEHYLVPLIYPEAITRETQIILAVLLVAGNLLIYALWARRGRRAAARR
ncbi:DUF2784 domain-containing protein [Achromobacter denitrificans]|jgi:hypothetical protein|uniref:DUF2784 domain-containing protein n=1 Tax=Achromobacter denitrificans TaxID=32002 RepID=A0A6N0JKT4_ACHDE|nr:MULTISPECIES: DUF2784 domain-containing protein [Achromobacter]ASC67495.1 hypothetical protein B9P52_25925 [Achromobacter denitrificans]MBV2158772.1 DUF2784 domain-containing protein [Achromobacter denitrificans]MDF3851037.1 DUF2784 domain-containing protein [Achromobacter denitrificans]MDF3862596.1 DUF2784 domain-containing protein [Achromobacter denitrificans]MDF3940517.1 DUF2784 domain-containing protein [Achromobacter denitrificans]